MDTNESIASQFPCRGRKADKTLILWRSKYTWSTMAKLKTPQPHHQDNDPLRGEGLKMWTPSASN